MNGYSQWRKWLLAVFSVCAVTVTACHSSGGEANDSGGKEVAVEEAAVAKVQVMPLKHEKIEESLLAYGTVVAALGESETYSVPFEARVVRMLSIVGQETAKGTPLVEIEPSPETRLLLRQAKNEESAASTTLRLLQDKVRLKLATKNDLAEAEQKAQAARTALEDFRKRGVESIHQIRATSSGLVSEVHVQPGQVLAAGTTMMETIGQKQINVKLGVENEDVGTLQMGQAVTLRPVNASSKETIKGTIRLITREIDPQTRLINVFVLPEANNHLLLNQYIEGSITTSSSEGLVVPQSAVLPNDGDQVLFTVENGHAVRHVVEIGLQSKDKCQVFAKDLKEGQMAAISGNYELQDGMAIEMEKKP